LPATTSSRTSARRAGSAPELGLDVERQLAAADVAVQPAAADEADRGGDRRDDRDCDQDGAEGVHDPSLPGATSRIAVPGRTASRSRSDCLSGTLGTRLTDESIDGAERRFGRRAPS